MCVHLCVNVYMRLHTESKKPISSAPFVPLPSPPVIFLMPLWAGILWILSCLEANAGLFYPVKS